MSPEIITKIVNSPGRRDRSGRDAAESITRAADALGRVAARRHIFLFVLPEETYEGRMIPALESAARENNIAIHAISTGEEEVGPIRKACAESGGAVLVCSPESLSDAVFGAYVSLTGRYRVRYRPGEGAGKVTLTAYSAAGIGRAELACGS